MRRLLRSYTAHHSGRESVFPIPICCMSMAVSKNGLHYQFLKGMPLEMCLFQDAEEENQITEYRQPSVIEQMAAAENSLAYQNQQENTIETEIREEAIANENSLASEMNTGDFVPVQAPVARYAAQQLTDPAFIKRSFTR